MKDIMERKFDKSFDPIQYPLTDLIEESLKPSAFERYSKQRSRGHNEKCQS